MDINIVDININPQLFCYSFFEEKKMENVITVKDCNKKQQFLVNVF